MQEKLEKLSFLFQTKKMRNKTKNPIQSREFLQDLWHSYNTVHKSDYYTIEAAIHTKFSDLIDFLSALSSNMKLRFVNVA